MKNRSIILLVILCAVMGGGVLAAPPPGLAIQRHVMGGGGALSAAGTYGIGFTLGQPLAETHRTSGMTLGTGFWASGAVPWEVYLPLVAR